MFSRLRLGLVAFYLLCALLAFFAAYHVFFGRKIIPGVYVGVVDVGGLTYGDAEKKLADTISSLPSELSFVFEDNVYTTSLSDLDITYNPSQSVQRALQVGRTGNLYIDTKDKIAGLIGKKLTVPASLTHDEKALNNFFAVIVGTLDVQAKDARFSLDEEGRLSLVESSAGFKVDHQNLYDQSLWSLNNFDFTQKILLVEKVYPKVNTVALKLFEPKIKALLKNEITLVPQAVPASNNSEGETQEKIKVTKDDEKDPESKNGNSKLGSESVSNFPNFEPIILSDLEKLSLVEVSKVDDSYSLVINKPQFEAYTSAIAQEVNTLPRGKITAISNDIVTEFEFVEPGYELEKKSFERNLKDALLWETPVDDIGLEEKKPTSVVLTFNKIEGAADPSKYGIYKLIGEGTSKYTGSAPSRIHNLLLAAKRTDGVLVPPGEIYSFNTSVGKISSSTGYATAYVISNGRTVLGDGGGVCQTSTTLFRAALNSGLPIVTRHPHAYRVGYYEIESPVGVDASIYQPSLDFEFKNDTPNFILIEAVPNEVEYSLTFKLYGTPDGRKVEISEPVVSNQSPPPPALYQDDPTLPKGVVKQVDFAAWGATASFNRIVYKDDKKIIEDTFVTRYQPWRAVYLVGTK
ncbi:VanW family protein [Candidatus Nomurabacteria bacterium]|uniref:VanW family protein n=1 Tax=candidate division WWE3 bacterium TaxID=2053526 RepID=A0A955IW74_UNCKA|nr:VanW family protein [candidate division WWE3 bacterium]MCB9823390.1 VanW family protein [Candidatus Nomurabacteria bacterium]MCB9827672.1 VanW family protein [Candidatus Nomurabacteria bacterium]HXK52843.1 VanW family protein [bacterium]